MKNNCEICDSKCWGSVCSLECGELWQAELNARYGALNKAIGAAKK